MKIVLSGGGTAGHVNPAVAIGKILKSNIRGCEILFIGRDGGAENALVSELGCEIKLLKVEGLRKWSSPHNLAVLVRAIKATARAKKILREFKPDLVLGTGGYVCLPVLSAAIRLGYKTAIHESNAYPGKVTRLLAKRCDAVLLGSEYAGQYLKKCKNVQVVGNPVRPEFFGLTRERARRKLGIDGDSLLIASFAGSLGAERINEVMLELFAMKEYTELSPMHVHATGKRHYEAFTERLAEMSYNREKIKIVPYIDNMPILLPAADIAVTRSGAMTVAELTAAGTPAILIPSPNVADDHQTKNAELLSRGGEAVMIREAELTADRLLGEIKALFQKRPRRWETADGVNARRDGTARKIWNALKPLMKEK